MIPPKHKIAYCHLAKVGSSSWKTNLIPLMSNRKLQEYVHQSTTMSKSQFEVDENGIQAKKMTKQYFKNVEQSIVKQIIQYYELDFLLFQYSTRDILK